MPTNQELLERRKNAVPRGVASATGVFAARAEDAEVWDVEGKRYIDFAGGIGVQNAGHRHPKVQAAVREQIERYTHPCFQVTPYEPYVALAEKLNRLAPTTGPNKTIFLTTGAEAIENAVKIARAATKRPAVISFVGGFHGRTMMTLALTGKVEPYKKGFGPFPGEVYHVPYPNRFHDVTAEDALQALAFLFKADVEPSRVAAILIEPVQGEGGFYIAPFDFLRALRKLCDEHGILLIADEIQCGFGRTGKMFAIEHAGVKPDLVVMAKSLAGGMPLSAVTGRAELMDAVEPGGLGGTYAGNPVACAAGLAVLEVFEEEKLLERSTKIGEKIVRRMTELAASNRFPCIGEVRGLGGMVAIELVEDRTTKKPAAALAKRWSERSLANGLILLNCGVYANVARVLVPLTASDAIIDEALGLLERSLEEAMAA
ncbi:MAG TPA: 4-aminobutyrate--2-oxoglutarate transaminase [Alphaproteobacteria bacterium]|nr:4-aminobutyrate--2-oxoglutarate transaminase [Alphaproteobacteria bacterium]